MALYSIAIRSAPEAPAAIKVVRALGVPSISRIRELIGSDEPVVTIDTSAYGIELDPVEGHKQQHARIRAAIEQLEAAGCEITLSYRVATDDLAETIANEQIENFFAAELTYLEQSHD